jgi:hypothetical protein
MTSPSDRTSGRTRHRRRLPLLVAALVAALVGSLALVGSQAGALVPGSPEGGVSTMTHVAEEVYTLTGWAADPNTTSAIAVRATVDNVTVAKATANLSTPKVPYGWPGYGRAHGYTINVVVRYGTHTICMIAGNVGAGADTWIWCRTITLDNSPHGSLTARQVPGGVTVSGQAYDPNSINPIYVDISDNGKVLKRVYGNTTAYKPHGYTATFLLPAGSHKLCATGINIGWGWNRYIGCQAITLNYNPTASMTSASQVPAGVAVAGWARDPDTTSPVTVALTVDSRTVKYVTANGTSSVVAGHGFAATLPAGQGNHTVCAVARNLSYGSGPSPASCRTVSLNFNPSAALTSLYRSMNGVSVGGWATDPNTTGAVTVMLTVDGKAAGQVSANGSSSVAPGHGFWAGVPVGEGTHTICAYAVNVGAGNANSPLSCKTANLDYSPIGAYESAYHDGNNMPQVTVIGWALDINTTSPINVAVSVDGGAPITHVANVYRSDIASKYGNYGGNHGFSFDVPTDAAEHTLCVTAVNVAAGHDVPLGCKTVIAVNATAPQPPTNVAAQAGFGGAVVNWTAPADDGGAPITSYVVTASPGGASVTVGGTATTATVGSLAASTTYTFSVVATNKIGSSTAAVSAPATTQAGPPAQTTPAPVSTSRYIRNIGNTGSSTDLSTMRSEGATDAYYNPSGHGYLILLDIGGQDEYDGGVLLSATTKFVSYANLVKNIESYVDGYASKQNASAPVVIAIGTNNDMDVSTSAGQSWANKVVDPVLAYAAKYPGIMIAGANDIEPGFRGSYSASKAWLQGFLGSTSAAFVFNGSADGCSWTTTGAGCNNGWTMSGLYSLAAGVAPTRILNLPQVYNNTMAAQWKYISLTGVVAGNPRINFAGALTEWTACSQGGGCSSITGNQAWNQLWINLQSDARLQVASLPYSTDLRVDS